MEVRANVRPALLPIGLAIAIFLSYVTFLAVPIGVFQFGLALLLAVYPMGAVAFGLLGSFALVVLFWRRSRISGIAMVIGLATLTIAVAVPAPQVPMARRAVDLVHVIAYSGELQRQIQEALRKGDSPALASIEIGGWAGGGYGIGYDPTGEVALPVEERSKPWKVAAEQTFFSVDGVEVRHIVGNYYALSY